MPKQQLDNLITSLHEQFGLQETSAEQHRWLSELQRGEHESSPQDTANLLLESLENGHPKTAAILREIIDTLGRLGI